MSQSYSERQLEDFLHEQASPEREHVPVGVGRGQRSVNEQPMVGTLQCQQAPRDPH